MLYLKLRNLFQSTKFQLRNFKSPFSDCYTLLDIYRSKFATAKVCCGYMVKSTIFVASYNVTYYFTADLALHDSYSWLQAFHCLICSSRRLSVCEVHYLCRFAGHQKLCLCHISYFLVGLSIYPIHKVKERFPLYQIF